MMNNIYEVRQVSQEEYKSLLASDLQYFSRHSCEEWAQHFAFRVRMCAETPTIVRIEGRPMLRVLVPKSANVAMLRKLMRLAGQIDEETSMHVYPQQEEEGQTDDRDA